MDIHKPKPWHGWREFLKEYLIIVVGVLTALAAEQAVEWLRVQHSLEALRAGLRAELVENRSRWEANRSQDPCASKRLDQILAWAASAPPDAVTGAVSVPVSWNIHSSAWDSAKANPLSLHMPAAEYALYAAQYDVLAGLQRDLNEEHRAWVQISALLEQGDGADDKRALRKMVVVQKDALERRRFNYANVFARFDALDIPTQPVAKLNLEVAQRLCAPLATAAAPHP